MSTYQLSLSDIQTLLSGTNPISLSEYYRGLTYVANVDAYSNIPLSGQISISNFMSLFLRIVAGDGVGDIDTTNGIALEFATDDDSYARIGMDFEFYWFGTDYGTNNAIFWSTNNYLSFGRGWGVYSYLTEKGISGIFFGAADRYNINSVQFPSVSINNNYIKKIVIISKDYGYEPTTINYVIRLIKSPMKQYIELRIPYFDTSYRGVGFWDISDGVNFYNIFSSIISQGQSLVLESDSNGNNWKLYNNYYVDI